MYDNRSITLGTKVFLRTDDLERLLNSIPNSIDEIIIADDGETSERTHLYDKYDVDVIDMEWDKGIGAGRHEIAQMCDTDLLLIVDSDNTVPTNYTDLIDVLSAHPDLGGVGGIMFEGEYPTPYFQTFEEVNDVLIRTPAGTEWKMRDGTVWRRVDLIPNVAVFRSECLEDGSWDPRYRIEMEHLDFFYNHWKNTDWEFAGCLDVFFPHYPGGGSEYLSKRGSRKRALNSRRKFLKKWDLRQEIDRGPVGGSGPNGLRRFLPVQNLRAEVLLQDLNPYAWWLSERIR